MTGTTNVPDTFVFKPSFGTDLVNNIQVTGTAHDTLEFDHSNLTRRCKFHVMILSPATSECATRSAYERPPSILRCLWAVPPVP
jgi:hypothetical protein